MKTLRITALFCAVLMLALSFTACNTGSEKETTTTSSTELTSSSTEKTEIKISALKGPTGMGSAYLMSRNDAGFASNKYSYNIESAADAVVSDLLAGNIDIAAIPTTAAANLYNKTAGKIKILGISTLSVLYIVEKGESVKDIASLKDKTIVSAGQGTNVEYVLNYILKENGLTPGKDVKLEFVSEHSETVTKAKTGGADIVLLPEPFVTQLTSGESDFRMALDLALEWEKASDKQLPMGVIAVRSEFAEKNAEALALFMDEYKLSVEYVNGESNRSDAAKLIENYDVMPAAVAEKAIPNCNIVFINGDGMKDILNSFFELMYAENTEIIGAALPDDNIYYIAE